MQELFESVRTETELLADGAGQRIIRRTVTDEDGEIVSVSTTIEPPSVGVSTTPST